jgi:hypothetical protein
VTAPQSSWVKWIVIGVVGIIAVCVAGRWLAHGPECPNHSSYPLHLRDGVYDTLPLAGEITAVPEFHDCQRLLVKNGGGYGPLAGIWVSANLASRSERLGPIKVYVPSRDSGLATVSEVSPYFTPRSAPPSTLSDSAIALALVYAWDDWRGGYPDLGISTGWNCLYFARRDSEGGLTARMAPVDHPSDCLQNLSKEKFSALESAELAVRPVGRLGPTGDEIPEVGRWDWDPKEKVNYIGLRCLAAWCEVSKMGAFTSSPQYSLPAAPPSGKPQTFSVKGWYDEQRLGERPWYSPRLRPSKVVGTIVPDPGAQTIPGTRRGLATGRQPFRWAPSHMEWSRSPCVTGTHVSPTRGMVRPTAVGPARRRNVTADGGRGPARRTGRS